MAENNAKLDSLIDCVYSMTMKPLPLTKLSCNFEFCGNEFDLEVTSKKLGYYSFNYLLRQNANSFKFLRVFICKESPNKLTLWYLNKKSENEFVVQEKVPEPYTQISIEDTQFFEYHNSKEFLKGREYFAHAVNNCQNKNQTDSKTGKVPFNFFQDQCKESFNEEYNICIKKWFPHAGKMTKISENILFEEIDVLFMENGALQFSIKTDYSFQHKLQNLENLQNQSKEFYEKINQRFNGFQRGKEREVPPLRAPVVVDYTENQRGTGSRYFVDSDGEDDRVENARYVETDVKKTSNVIYSDEEDEAPKAKPTRQAIVELPPWLELFQNYDKLCEDRNLENYFL